jgi:uncharacterized protein YjbI with pentapeptide repeats
LLLILVGRRSNRKDFIRTGIAIASARSEDDYTMANPQHIAKLNDGFATWNSWRASNNPSIDLTGASLDASDFTSFKLQDANFEGASLRGAKLSVGTEARGANFKHAELHGANFEGSDLSDANFEGSDLSDATFNGADISEASFRGANLRCVDLSNVRGALEQEQLASADLTAAKLPDSLSRVLTDLGTLKALSDSSRNLLFAVLAACLYCWLTIATTTDGNLITNHTSSPLPVIQATIPIVGFFYVAPLLLLCISLYFHFYLQRLMEEVASLPAVFQDGRPLQAKVDTWLMNEFVDSRLRHENVGRPFLSHIQVWISVLLAWWVVPMTIFLFWARYLRRHEWYGTIFHIVTLTVTIISAWCLTRLAIATLRGTERPPFHWKLILRNRRVHLISLIALAGFCLLGIVSLGVIRGNCNEDKPNHCPLDAAKLSTSTLIPTLMSLIGYHPFADLSGQEISVKEANWTDKPNGESASVRPAKLKGWDLRNARMESAFLEGTDLSNANLTNAFLVNANLRWVQLSDAKLAGANFSNADLRGANLAGVDLGSGPILQGANLTEADLSDAVLTDTCLIGAQLVDALLPDADLTKSVLTQADLSSANLSSSKLKNADLKRADLTDADLTGANLTGADLTRADLTGADLTDADLTRANLTGANLTRADFTGVNLKFTDLRQITGLTPGQVQSAAWNDALYDAGLLSSLGLETNHNEKLEEQPKKEKGRRPPCT